MQFCVFSHISFLRESFIAESANVGLDAFMHASVVEHVPGRLHLLVAAFVSALEDGILVSANRIIFNDYFVIVVFQYRKIYIRL